MFGRIKSALGREGEARRPEPLAPYESPTKATVERSELVARFMREAEAANIIVSFAETDEDVEKYLDSFVLRQSCGVVALSDAVAASCEGLAARLSERGLRVVVPPGEPAPVMFADVAHAADNGNSASRPGVGSDVDAEGFKAALFEAGVGVTAADYAIAETGTLVLGTGGERHRLISLLPPVHVCLLDARRIVGTLAELLAHFRERGEARGRPPQALTFITGPSRTADVEQTLALGVHGPHELHVLLRTLT
ncbi:MAG TPA: lactate utilization protein [Pyrinomonadaceae bacterium]|nr:lactate utilization protein [Pyrinomonadaceae bacterium]